jgi:hypothetical protein
VAVVDRTTKLDQEETFSGEERMGEGEHKTNKDTEPSL